MPKVDRSFSLEKNYPVHLCRSLLLSEHFLIDDHDCPVIIMLRGRKSLQHSLQKALEKERDWVKFPSPWWEPGSELLHLLSSESGLLLTGFSGNPCSSFSHEIFSAVINYAFLVPYFADEETNALLEMMNN